MLLGELVKKFPLQAPPQIKPAAPPSVKTEPETTPTQNDKEKPQVKEEKTGKPPEKKPRVH